jgi:fatty acid desaturase
MGKAPSTPHVDASQAGLISKEDASQGRFIPRQSHALYPVPEKLNLLLVTVQLLAAFAILTAASRFNSWEALACLAVVFAFAMQMGFCLAHEAVHRKLHGDPSVNRALGIVVFSLFPGSFHFFEVAHLIHHRRNRSNDELEDYVMPEERVWIKRVMYYLLISGLFWLLLPLSSLVVATIPSKRIRLPRPNEEDGVFRKFAQFLNQVRPNRVRRDILVTALIWGIAFPLLHLRLISVALCYGAFSFSWASQQYIYHVRTPRHAVLGALDLKLWKPVEMLYLHFNYHLTHHLAVWVPWNHLPAVAAERPARGYLKTYIALWQPPELLQESWPEKYQTSGPLPSRVDRLAPATRELPW